jgi:hypothetical protein
MKHQSETKPISADGNRLFFRRLASWQALAAARKSAQATIAPETIEPAATAALFPAKFLGAFGNCDSEARSKIELDGVAGHADRIGSS